MKRKSDDLLRVLCGIVDFMIVMLPIQFVMMGVFQVSSSQADLLFKLLYAVYGALAAQYLGMTLGKYFGRLKVVDISGEKPAMLYMGLRELGKTMYFIPYAGWGIGMVSLVMMLVRKDGRTLHDLIGNTRVVYRWQTFKGEEELSHDDK